MPPPQTIRIATFNAENLFARYRFRDGLTPSLDGFTINQLAFDILDDAEKRITAQAIRQVDADVICLQEVENLEVLDSFASRYLAAMKYRHRIVIDGNDPRAIDVAVLSRLPFANIRTHRHERTAAGSAPLFSRDCLEVELDVHGRSLTLYVNHLKSMMDGRAATKARRKAQADRVAQIINERWAAGAHAGNYIVLGDLNDYMGAGTALTGLVGHPQLVNVLNRLPAADRWTHFWAEEAAYKQLDYVLIPRKFDARAGSPVPTVMRMGLPHRAERYPGPRFPDVGQNEPKASDHCPVMLTIPFAALA